LTSSVVDAVSSPIVVFRNVRVFHSPRSSAHDGRGTRHHEELVMVQRSLVSVVDDDESVRESLPDLLRQFGFAVQAFSSAEAFLASEFVGQTNCLILDIAMVGMSGPDLQQELARRRQAIPIVFITALGDKTIRPRLLAQGAAECLFKPFQRRCVARGAHQCPWDEVIMRTVSADPSATAIYSEFAGQEGEGEIRQMLDVTPIAFVAPQFRAVWCST
jgi:CheY-like chemotaxis protein